MRSFQTCVTEWPSYATAPALTDFPRCYSRDGPEELAMQIRILVALLSGLAAAGSVAADTIVVNDQVQVRESRADVQKHFGAPVTRHPAVGGGSPQRPPITRWDYNGFSVVFEKDRVIDSVVTGAETASQPSSGCRRLKTFTWMW